MARRVRPLVHLPLVLLALLPCAPPAFGVCTEIVLPIFQCGYQGWFAPAPAGSGAISAVWWQLGYGNLTHNSLPSPASIHEGTGYVGGEGFTGNDSGLFHVTMTDADAVLPAWAGQIPDGALCSDYQNTWGSASVDPTAPGGLHFVDGCADNLRTSQSADDDNLLNPYWGAAYGPCASDNCPYETLNYQVDYPLAFLLRESTSRFFALAFVASKSRNADSSDVSEGVFDLGAVVNGEPNPITGANSVIPWQPVPWPRVDSSTDNGATLTLALSWGNIRLVHDGSIRPSARVEAGGVGVLDHLAQPGGLCRYRIQTAPVTVSNPDPSTLSWVDAGEVIDCPSAPGPVAATLTVDHDTAIRVRTLLGKRPRTASTLLEDVRRGASGDLGFESTACLANDCVAGPPLLIVGNAPMNQLPFVHAGADFTVDHTGTAVLLSATVLDDGLPPPPALTTLWSMESGPGVVTFGDPAQVDTTASFSDPGTYVLRLTASDGQLEASDTVGVVVGRNEHPVVDAGPDQTITLPSEVTLNGTVTDDGMPPGGWLATQWSVDSGPGVVFFLSQIDVDTTAAFIAAGTYVLRLSANDGELSSSDTVTIVVHPRPVNRAPMVSAGPDQDIFLPPGVAHLAGSVTDDGLPSPALSISWIKESGPGEVTFSTVLAADTMATFERPGRYVLRLAAWDGQLSGNDVVVIQVDSSNQAPGVDAGPDQDIVLPGHALLHGLVSDDGLPAPPSLLIAWSVDSGPATVVFGNAAAPETTASFTVAGTYVLRLTANDGWAATSDTLSVRVTLPHVSYVVESRVALGTDDAEEKSVAGISLTSGDLEMVQEAEVQTVGVRFNHLPIPRAAIITRAWVQFTTREKQSEETTLVLRAQASDSAQTFTLTRFSISTRPVTLASVSWTPAPWTAWGEAGPDQRTPDIASLLQEVVNRPGWSEGNAIALIITGAGHRTAMSYEGSAASAALLHVEVAEVLVNRPPEVDAGVDLTIRFPEGADLNGTVTDDGLPLPPGHVSTQWSQISGPAPVTFLNPLAVDTRADFPEPGLYELRLRADDGELQDDDTVVVNVREPSPALVTLDVSVATPLDDVEEKGTGTMSLDSSDLELVQDTTTQRVGLRFAGLTIPDGAIIREAWIQFQVDEMSPDTAGLAVQGQASDDAPPFSAVKFDVSTRPLTAAWVPWSPVPWTVIGEAGPPQRTPDLSGIVQEIVNRPGWTSGGSMVFIITGSGRRTAEAFESGPLRAPRLHVAYE